MHPAGPSDPHQAAHNDAASPSLEPVTPHVLGRIAGAIGDATWLEIWREDSGVVRLIRAEDAEAITFYEPDGEVLARFPVTLTESWRATAGHTLTQGCRRSRLAVVDARENPELAALDELVVGDLNLITRRDGDFDDRRLDGGAVVYPGAVSQDSHGVYKIELVLVPTVPPDHPAYHRTRLGLTYRIAPEPMHIIASPGVGELRRATGWQAPGTPAPDASPPDDALATSVFQRALPVPEQTTDDAADVTMPTELQPALPPLDDEVDGGVGDEVGGEVGGGPGDDLATDMLPALPDDEPATDMYTVLDGGRAEMGGLDVRLTLHVRAPPSQEREQMLDQAVVVNRLPFAIGRSSKRVDLPIRNGEVSRVHCLIVADVRGFYVHHVGERNATIVDGQAVQRHSRSGLLRHGSRILVGDAEIICELG